MRLMELHAITSVLHFWARILAKATVNVIWWAGVRWRVRKNAVQARATVKHLERKLEAEANRRLGIERELMMAKAERDMALQFWMQEAPAYREQMDTVLKWALENAARKDEAAPPPIRPRISARALQMMVTQDTVEELRNAGN